MTATGWWKRNWVEPGQASPRYYTKRMRDFKSVIPGKQTWLARAHSKEACSPSWLSCLQIAALRLNCVPGNQDGRCRTARHILVHSRLRKADWLYTKGRYQLARLLVAPLARMQPRDIISEMEGRSSLKQTMTCSLNSRYLSPC